MPKYSGIKWNIPDKKDILSYELSGRKAVKFRFKTYKDYLKESKKVKARRI